MAVAFALLTSDSNLLPCELTRLAGEVRLEEGARTNVAGVGWFSQEGVLLRRFPVDATPKSTAELVGDTGSEALVYRGGALPLGMQVEDAAQPFRFRGWLFAHVGVVQELSRVRPRLLAMLPDFLQRQVRGETDSEAVFALFLKYLRETGRTDDRGLNAALAAQLLSRTVRTLQQLATEAGASRPSVINLIATNGSMLVATRSGEEPLYYALLEGTNRCDRCKLNPSSADDAASLRAHRRRRSVAIATHPASSSNGWIELPAGSALAVDRDLNIQRLPV